MPPVRPKVPLPPSNDKAYRSEPSSSRERGSSTWTSGEVGSGKGVLKGRVAATARVVASISTTWLDAARETHALVPAALKTSPDGSWVSRMLSRIRRLARSTITTAFDDWQTTQTSPGPVSGGRTTTETGPRATLIVALGTRLYGLAALNTVRLASLTLTAHTSLRSDSRARGTTGPSSRLTKYPSRLSVCVAGVV